MPANPSITPHVRFLFGLLSCGHMRPQYSPRLRRVPPKVCNEIRRYRLQLGLTQRQVAKRLGIRLSTFSAWERGMTCPSLKMAARLGRALEVMAPGLYPRMFFGPDETVTDAIA